jgi:RNA polymerase sigma factor (sigma-70 family)
MPPTEATLTQWFEDHRAFLWGLSYRITGSAADADDVVQETFVKAHQHAPSQLADPRRWLMRVAVNAARDVLRRRKRRSYIGPWLPTPIETSGEDTPSFEPVVEGQTLEGRYDLMESASLAFLQALEALTPTQRAVLLLSDVFDYAAAEVAAVLDTTEGNVRIIHHRARRVMESYERRQSRPTASQRERAEKALHQFLALLAAGDVHGIEQMLATDVRTVTDANGEFTALFRPLVGRLRVAKFFAQFSESRRHGRVAVVIRQINGLPTADIALAAPRGRRPPRLLLSADLNTAGDIVNIWIIASSAKLARIPSEPRSVGVLRPS